MAKRYRDFLRVNMTAKTAKFISAKLVDLTFKDHYEKCADDPQCTHILSSNLEIARTIEAGLVIGSKRAHLDLACPYSTTDSQWHTQLLVNISYRLNYFLVSTLKKQLRVAGERVAKEIRAYADRNAMQVIAEAAL